jgi:hypothetical protein
VTPKAVGPAPRQASASTAAGVTGSVNENESFAPSSDLSSLLAAVRQTPDVRPEAIEASSAQLSSGALNTPQAATDAAQSLLNSGDLTPGQ